VARTIDGKAVAATVRAEVRERAARLAARGLQPGLATVLVGDDPASQVYVANKQKACAEVGIRSFGHRLPADVSQAALRDLVQSLGADPAVHGILVQLPLPKGLDADEIINAIPPTKDVDGLHPMSQGRLMAGQPGLRPCTPLGVMRLLDEAGVELKGAQAVVVGRSLLVGKPVALLLLERHATVTVCHSRTRDLGAVVREADVLVAAAGSPLLVKGDWIRPGAAVVDLGVNMVDGVQVGDVDFDAALGVAGLLTPSRGGVGPMTITLLLRNTVEAYKARHGLR